MQLYHWATSVEGIYLITRAFFFLLFSFSLSSASQKAYSLFHTETRHCHSHTPLQTHSIHTHTHTNSIHKHTCTTYNLQTLSLLNCCIVGRAGIPCTEALSSLQQTRVRLPAWVPLLHVSPLSLTLFPVTSPAITINKSHKKSPPKYSKT